MKKTYLKPQMLLLPVSMAPVMTVSGNFVEGETISEPISDETIDGGDAWSRRRNNVWDEEEETDF